MGEAAPPESVDRLRGLVATVAGFYVRDRALLRAQRDIERALERGEPSARDVARYVSAVKRYFEGFARDAQTHLRDVDRELERLYQRQYNMTAERGVAARRVEATQGVLAAIAEMKPE